MEAPSRDGGQTRVRATIRSAGPSPAETKASARPQPAARETLNHGNAFRIQGLKVGPTATPVFVCVQGEAALKQALRPVAPATKRTEPPATPKGDR